MRSSMVKMRASGPRLAIAMRPMPGRGQICAGAAGGACPSAGAPGMRCSITFSTEKANFGTVLRA